MSAPQQPPIEAIRERLWQGDTLALRFGEGIGFDVWVEKYATPPRVFCEGRPRPIEDLDAVMALVAGYLAEEGVRVEWNAEIPAKRERAGA